MIARRNEISTTYSSSLKLETLNLAYTGPKNILYELKILVF